LAPLEANLNRAFEADNPKDIAAALKALYAYIDKNRIFSKEMDYNNVYSVTKALEEKNLSSIQSALRDYKERMTGYEIKNDFICYMQKKDYEAGCTRCGGNEWIFKVKISSGGFFSPNPQKEGTKILKLTLSWFEKNGFLKGFDPQYHNLNMSVILTTDKKGDTGKTMEVVLGETSYNFVKDSFIWHPLKEGQTLIW
jgi:hypothetical protein